MAEKPIKHLRDLTPDNANPNAGTERGVQMLEESLQNYGAGRSILVDKTGRIICGNHVVEAAGAVGIEDVIVVQTDGKKLVVVQRTDLDLDEPHAREMAIADNRAAEVNIAFDPAVLAGLEESQVDLSKFWTGPELEHLAQRLTSGDVESKGDEKTVECPSCHHEFVPPPKGSRSPKLSLNERIRRAKPKAAAKQ